MRHVLSALTLCLTVVASTAAKGDQAAAPVAVKSAADLVTEGMSAYQARDFARAAALLQQAVKSGTVSSDAYYNAACATALAGDADTAFSLLHNAIAAGFRNTDLLKSDSDLETLRSDPRWAGLVTAAEASQAAWMKEHSDPSRVRFVTADIDRFWHAYDESLKAPPEARAEILQRVYVEPGTPGLADWIAAGRLKANSLAKTIDARPSFFSALRPLARSIDAQLTRTKTAFAKLKFLYPDAIFPDVYFVMGQINSGGTSSDRGLLMGAEMFSRDPAVPLHELTDWQRGAIMAPDEIPALVTHESIHFLQKYPQETLLCAVLREGLADFLGELASGDLIRRMKTTHAWANARERELWLEFRPVMEAKDTSRWLYGDSGGNGRPVDLGYWLGYKIGASYYRNAADKPRAIRDMLIIRDCRAFLAASRYEESLAGNTP